MRVRAHLHHPTPRRGGFRARPGGGAAPRRPADCRNTAHPNRRHRQVRRRETARAPRHSPAHAPRRSPRCGRRRRDSPPQHVDRADQQRGRAQRGASRASASKSTCRASSAPRSLNSGRIIPAASCAAGDAARHGGARLQRREQTLRDRAHHAHRHGVEGAFDRRLRGVVAPEGFEPRGGIGIAAPPAPPRPAVRQTAPPDCAGQRHYLEALVHAGAQQRGRAAGGEGSLAGAPLQAMAMRVRRVIAT